MDHSDISNTFDSTYIFMVAEAATSDMSLFQCFKFGIQKRPLRKLATKVSTFLFLFLTYASTFIYFKESKNCLFYILGKSVFSAVQFCVPVLRS
jgi:hypothetical protein